MDERKHLLELLLDPIESERAKAMADTLFQLESYLRVISLTLNGIEGKYRLPSGLSRDLWTLRNMADEVSAWLSSHYAKLYDYAERRPAPEPEREAEAERVIH